MLPDCFLVLDIQYGKTLELLGLKSANPSQDLSRPIRERKLVMHHFQRWGFLELIFSQRGDVLSLKLVLWVCLVPSKLNIPWSIYLTACHDCLWIRNYNQTTTSSGPLHHIHASIWWVYPMNWNPTPTAHPKTVFPLFRYVKEVSTTLKINYF